MSSCASNKLKNIKIWQEMVKLNWFQPSSGKPWEYFAMHLTTAAHTGKRKVWFDSPSLSESNELLSAQIRWLLPSHMQQRSQSFPLASPPRSISAHPVVIPFLKICQRHILEALNEEHLSVSLAFICGEVFGHSLSSMELIYSIQAVETPLPSVGIPAGISGNMGA
jgi:hypothetical protein